MEWFQPQTVRCGVFSSRISPARSPEAETLPGSELSEKHSEIITDGAASPSRPPQICLDRTVAHVCERACVNTCFQFCKWIYGFSTHCSVAENNLFYSICVRLRGELPVVHHADRTSIREEELAVIYSPIASP